MRIVFSLIFVLIQLFVFSQDKIVFKDGRQVQGKILSLDTLSVQIILNVDTTGEAVQFMLSDVEAIDWMSAQQKFGSDRNKAIDSSHIVGGNFLFLYSGQLINGYSIELKSPFFKERHFLVDGLSYDDNLVKFYQNDEGYFANTMRLRGSAYPTFSRRVKKGRMNLYEYTSYNTSAMSYGYAGTPGFGGHGTYGSVGGFGLGVAMPQTKYYYNKGFDDLKRISFENLSKDMVDNPMAMSALNDWEKTRKTGSVLMLSGILLTGVSFFALLAKTSDQKDPDVTLELMGLSVGFAATWVKYLAWDHGQNPRKLKKAIDIYNR
jgi:hypothetical protein